MKQLLFIFTTLFVSATGFSLHIRQVMIAVVSSEAINISLDTEAEELFYFSSWSYDFSGTTVVLSANFIKGFGSTIAFLNNNFEIPLETEAEQSLQLRVNVYYLSSGNETLEDYCIGTFRTPMNQPTFLSIDKANARNQPVVFVSNPNHGILVLETLFDTVQIFDQAGKLIAYFHNPWPVIDLKNLPDSYYFIILVRERKKICIPIILRKE